MPTVIERYKQKSQSAIQIVNQLKSEGYDSSEIHDIAKIMKTKCGCCGGS